MYSYATSDIKPIMPLNTFSSTNIADNFDESTVINSNLNMANLNIYNLKDPQNDQDASTKIYVDVSLAAKTYGINSANITGTLPYSRLSIPTNSIVNDKIFDIAWTKITGVPAS